MSRTRRCERGRGAGRDDSRSPLTGVIDTISSVTPSRSSVMVTAAAATLAQRYTTEFRGSKQRFEAAKGIFPCGVTHDTRMMDPFPPYVAHAKGAYKWDVDGHKLVDYFVGHG